MLLAGASAFAPGPYAWAQTPLDRVQARAPVREFVFLGGFNWAAVNVIA
ncbi:hypothetical protein APY03_3750 [Variovorax sp. WDL1]|nr:hypothetical protein APY03_3750 [Variovorax sp. WDL1]